VGLLVRLGFECAESDDPYTATLELSRKRLAYHALILSLSSLFREELSLIGTVKRRFPHLEIWLAHTDGRQAALAESMRLGADGLLDEEGLHRIAAPAAPVTSQPAVEQPTYHPMPTQQPASTVSVLRPDEEEEARRASDSSQSIDDQAGSLGEPVLSAEELRALLQDPNDPAEKQV
jgi:hypothetical protein